MASRPKILGAGLVALDVVISADPDEPVRTWAGGTCGNVLSIMASLGWDAYPIARLSEDSASVRVRADLASWGVRLELTSCAPTTDTPIIVQEIRRSKTGQPSHRFSWSCPHCGGWLPSFKPLTRTAVVEAQPYIPGTAVFFMDRVSRGTLTLAAAAADAGAIVVFEPSGRADHKLFLEALTLAHVLKYSDQRLPDRSVGREASRLILEVQTLGANGLRFRLPRVDRGETWHSLAAQPAEAIVDTCGSGDWCTAGLLARVAQQGLKGLEQATSDDIIAALLYGQQLAAWNCGFEGARGGMHAARAWRAEWSSGDRPRTDAVEPRDRTVPPVDCPQCKVA